MKIKLLLLLFGLSGLFFSLTNPPKVYAESCAVSGSPTFEPGSPVSVWATDFIDTSLDYAIRFTNTSTFVVTFTPVFKPESTSFPITVSAPSTAGTYSVSLYRFAVIDQAFDCATAIPGGVIDVQPAPPPTPPPPPPDSIVVDLRVNGSKTLTVPAGTTVFLSWTVTVTPSGFADNCIASGWWSGFKNTTSGSEPVEVPTNSTYRLACLKGSIGGSDEVSVTVTGATPAPTPPPNKITVDLTINGSNGPILGIPVGSSVKIDWTVNPPGFPDNCIASGWWSGTKSTSGGSEFVPITSDSTFTLACFTGPNGGSDSISVLVAGSPATPRPPTAPPPSQPPAQPPMANAPEIDLPETLTGPNFTTSSGLPSQVLSVFLPAILAILSFIAVYYMILASIRLIISKGDPEKVAEARSRLIYAVVGFIVLIIAFASLQLIEQLFLKTNIGR